MGGTFHRQRSKTDGIARLDPVAIPEDAVLQFPCGAAQADGEGPLAVCEGVLGQRDMGHRLMCDHKHFLSIIKRSFLHTAGGEAGYHVFLDLEENQQQGQGG